MTRRWRTPLFVALVLLAIVLPAAVRFYTDWLWFGETGYQDVFLTTLAAQGTLGGAAMAVAFGVLLLNLRIAMRTLSPRTLVVNTREGPIAIAVDRRRVQPLGTAVAAVLALLFGLYASGQWQDVAAVPSRAAVRRSGPGARQGHRLLRLPAPVPGRAPRLSARPGRALRRRCRCGVCGGRRDRLRSERGACGLPLRRSATWPRSPPRCCSCSHSARISTCRGCSRRRPASFMAPRTSMWPSGFRRLRVLMVAALAGAALALYQMAVAVLVADHHRSRPLHRRGRRGIGGGGGDAPVRHRAERAGPRDAVHRAQHQGDAKGVRAGQRRGARAVGRCAAHARRHRRERRHARQRPALGSRAAAADVRADPGDPHLLRLRLGAQRSVHDRRPVSADHAVGARAELRQPARTATGSTSG